MPGFTNFGKEWASGGAVAEPSAQQAAQGFSFLGNTPPSVELFNALFQTRDQQINWLYSQLDRVLRSAGITPANTPDTQLESALRTTFGGGGSPNGLPGWQRLPGGLIMQWGWVNPVQAGATRTIVYPVAFRVPFVGFVTPGNPDITRPIAYNIGGAGVAPSFMFIYNHGTVDTDVSWMVMGIL